MAKQFKIFMEKLHSAQEVSEILTLNVQTIQRFIRMGKIKAIKIGRTYRIKESDLESYAHLGN